MNVIMLSLLIILCRRKYRHCLQTLTVSLCCCCCCLLLLFVVVAPIQQTDKEEDLNVNNCTDYSFHAFVYCC